MILDRAVELANSLETSDPVAVPQLEHSSEFLREFSTYWMGKSLFDLREYRRAAHALRQCTSSEAFFLRCYSLYLVSGGHGCVLVSMVEHNCINHATDTLRSLLLAGNLAINLATDIQRSHQKLAVIISK